MLKGIIDKFKERYHQRCGLKHLHRSDYKKALKHFESALAISKSYLNYFYYSVILIALDRHELAITYLEKIIHDHSEDILIAVTLAESYMVVREWAKAEDLLTFLNKKFPNNTTIKFLFETCKNPIGREKYACGKEYFIKAKNNTDIKNYDAALEDINKAIELNEANASFYFYAGYIALQGKKRKEEVEAYFENAVFLAPQNEGFKKQLQYVKTCYK